jgi:hypothetical protein
MRIFSELPAVNPSSPDAGENIPAVMVVELLLVGANLPAVRVAAPGLNDSGDAEASV